MQTTLVSTRKWKRLATSISKWGRRWTRRLGRARTEYFLEELRERKSKRLNTVMHRVEEVNKTGLSGERGLLGPAEDHGEFHLLRAWSHRGRCAVLQESRGER
jgi:hypothetical protein